jgi:tRNA uridine 5-carboxymethylaminomethyl modification enzyme
VTDLIIGGSEGGVPRVGGVVTQRGRRLSCAAFVVAAGTVLERKSLIGEYDAPQGRLGEEAALGLGQSLRRRGFPMGRLKTGTPARIAGSSVDYSVMEKQDGEEPAPFSFDVETGSDLPSEALGNVPCWITYTCSKTHEIIRSNIHRSPLYGGKIKGTGARYCPSIEDKVMRFPDRPRHHVFVEPEGLYTNEIYLNGCSTSLPEDVQGDFIRSIPGLEEAKIVRPGYAVEYDYLDPLDLYPSLESKRIAGFFSAGQTNGSSGYEEAAAQGLMAGINASLRMRGEAPFVLGRADAYIGVLVDDLTTLGTKEPYRMFTSRAEHRLVLRHDTADTRLTPRARELGLVDEQRWERFQLKIGGLELIRELLARQKLPNGETLEKRLVREPLDLRELLPDLPALEAYPFEWIERTALDIRYSGYIEKENRTVEKLKKMDFIKIPQELDYTLIQGLSVEAKEKLKAVRPLTIGQAARIPGVRQGDIALLLLLTRRTE